jgi:hypothetical protein
MIVRVLCVSAVVFLSACGQESYWERTLIGPFKGEPFDGRLATQPVSSIQVPPNFVLDVHWEDATKHPIIRLREAGGATIWSQVLVPQFEGENEPRGRITTLTLRRVRPANDGFKIMFSCFWIGGGTENGIIYLNKDHTFRHFSLGW